MDKLKATLADFRVPGGVKRFMRVLAKSLLPGACLSLILFAHAFVEDAAQKRSRDMAPDIDLSGIRIEKRALSKAEPFIEIYYPSRPDYSFIDGAGGETWQSLTINGVPLRLSHSSIEESFAIGVESGYYCWIQGTRPLKPYRVFIDRVHNLELRFYDSYLGGTDSVRLMPVDNRGAWGFITRRDPVYDDARIDYGGVYGPKLFSDLEIHGFLHKIAAIITENRFLFYMREYFYIPIYGTFWLFPLLWAIEARKPRWFVPLVFWYPLWYLFCGFTLIVRQ